MPSINKYKIKQVKNRILIIYLRNLLSKLDTIPRIIPPFFIFSRVVVTSGNKSQVRLPEKSVYKSVLILSIKPSNNRKKSIMQLVFRL